MVENVKSFKFGGNYMIKIWHNGGNLNICCVYVIHIN